MCKGFRGRPSSRRRLASLQPLQARSVNHVVWSEYPSTRAIQNAGHDAGNLACRKTQRADRTRNLSARRAMQQHAPQRGLQRAGAASCDARDDSRQHVAEPDVPRPGHWLR